MLGVSLERKRKLIGFDYTDKEECRKYIKKNPSIIRIVSQYHKDLSIEAVRLNGLVIKYITNPSTNVCIEAVRQNPQAISYIKHRTPKLCEEALKQDPLALMYIDHLNNEEFAAILPYITDENFIYLEDKYIELMEMYANEEFQDAYKRLIKDLMSKRI